MRHTQAAFGFFQGQGGLNHVDEVWSSDITYVLMRNGFMYLKAVIDWFSR